MAIDFPNSPTVGQVYPSPAVPGTPIYQWDGNKWVMLLSGGVTGPTGVTGPPGSGGSVGATGPTGTMIDINKNAQSTAYTTVLSDDGKMIVHPSADTTARTFTIDSNANVAYPIGAVLTFVNESGAGVLTIAITSDTLYFAGAASSTGSRTLTAVGIASAVKVETTTWIINGTGLS